MNGVFKVLSVKEVKGFDNSRDSYPNRYGSGLTKRSNDPKSLLIKGTLDGKDTSFFSPTVVVSNVTGIVNYKSLPNNKWFSLVAETAHMIKGDKQFDGGGSPNFAIDRPSQVVPNVKEGDVINISYKPKGEYYGTTTIKSVKLI